MVVYERGEESFILMNNSSRGVMKLPAGNLDQFDGITERTDVTGVPYETVEHLKGVQQLDKLNESTALLLVRSEEGSLTLETVPFP